MSALSALDQELVEAFRALLGESATASQPPGALLEAIHFYLTLALAHRAQFKLYTAAQGRVLSGPFKGMRFPSPAKVSRLDGILPIAGGSPNIAGLLLGTYEGELHDPIERLLASRNYGLIIDVGCSIGYYAVGLALRQPGAIVHARDTNTMALDHLREMAVMNGVSDRVIPGGQWSGSDFNSLNARAGLVFCDIEGAEKQLLDPSASPFLTGCDIIVELHDVFDPTISSTLVQRFSGSHDIQLITNGSYRPPLPGEIGVLSRHEAAAVLTELRLGPTPWAVMTARVQSPR